LVRLDGHAEALFEEDDQLERADRVEDAAGDQGGLLGQLARVLAGEELTEEVIADDALDFLHQDLSARGQGGWTGRFNPGCRSPRRARRRTGGPSRSRAARRSGPARGSRR